METMEMPVPVPAHRLGSDIQQLNIDFSKVDLDSIQLPPGEDFGIKSDDEEEEEDSLEFETGFGNIIVVDNLPVVPPEKFEKLEGVVRKIFGQIGTIRERGLWMPIHPDTQKTQGYCFIEYNTPQEAQTAKDQTNGYKLDKSHVFAVNMFDDFDKYMKISNEWVPPETKAYTPGENLQQWLTDEKGRDQFVIRANTDTEVYWNDPRQLKPELVYRRGYWTESFVQWSSLGTYLATVHRQGAAIWGGGTTFNRLMRFAHPQVKLIDFSPGEKYLVTYSSHEPSNPRDTQRVTLNIFDVRTGKVLREFKGSADDFATGGTGGVAGVSWPVFRWAGGRDDKYFARIGKNAISVYETDSMSLLDKKSLKVDNVMDFSWSPTDPILALFVPEGGGGNQPAKVSLVQIPGREELRQKNLFSVSDCKMYWQSNGDYLAVKVDRYTKTKKSTYTGFELFRIKERDIPIEVLELENKNDKIIAFAWEPKGHRFAIIHGDGPRPDVSFYSMRSPNNVGRVSKLATIKGKQANSLYWSPIGRFIILAGLKALNGQLEFYNVDELETMATGEHFMATDIEWDPTGRYAATSVTSVHEMENGFNIWSFNGKLLYRIPRDHFYQLLWRPRPLSLLTPEKEEEIAKNLRKYSKKYEAEDQDVSLLLSEQDREKRKRLQEDWQGWVNEWKRLHEEEKLLRQALVFVDDDRSAQVNVVEQVSDADEVRVSTDETGSSGWILSKTGDERSLPETGSEMSSSMAEIFKCFICFGKVIDAQLCPCCSKLVCLTCIRRWLLEQKPQCPHCRTPLLVSQLVSCKFISEITEELDKIRGKATTNHTEKLCSVHQSPLSYFCSTCSFPVCSDCAILDEDHRNHSFERLIVIYGRHKKKIQKEAASLRHRLKELSLEVLAIDNNIGSILKTKDENLVELQAAYACMQKRLEEQLKCKLLALLTQKGSLTKEMELAETVLHELDNQLNKIPKSDLIAQEPMMCRMLQDIRKRTFLEAPQTPISTDFISEVVPRYEHGKLVIKNFTSYLNKAKPQDFHRSHDSEANNVTDVSKEIIYSETLFASGVTWRLKVYPNGSATSKGTHISVFMEMLEGNTETSTYEFCIEMLHRSYPHQSILRNFSSDFEVGACWGCHQFFQIDLLEKEGYLLPKEDIITFRFHVKALTFSQQCEDLKRALAAVQIERNDALAQLTAVRRAFAANIRQCHHRKSNHPMHSGRPSSPLILEEMDKALSISEPSRKLLNPNRAHKNTRDQNKIFEKPDNRQCQSKHSQQDLIYATCMSGGVNWSGLSKPRECNVVEELAVTLKEDIGDISRKRNLELVTSISLSGENFAPIVPSSCTVQGSSKEKCEAWLRTRDECQVSLNKARMHRNLKNKRLQKYLMHHSTGFHCNFIKKNTCLASTEEPSDCNDIDHDEIARLDRTRSALSVGSVEPRDSSKDESDARKESPEHQPIGRTECSGNEMLHPSDSLRRDNLLQNSEHAGPGL